MRDVNEYRPPEPRMSGSYVGTWCVPRVCFVAVQTAGGHACSPRLLGPPGWMMRGEPAEAGKDLRECESSSQPDIAQKPRTIFAKGGGGAFLCSGIGQGSCNPPAKNSKPRVKRLQM